MILNSCRDMPSNREMLQGQKEGTWGVDNSGNAYRHKVTLSFSADFSDKTVSIRGRITNTGERVVNLVGLKVRFKNFEGFVMEVDSLDYEGEIPPGESRAFAFPERARPLNPCSWDVVVSRIRIRQ